LCVITDTTVQSVFTHEELAALAGDGGADMIQLRDKSLDDRELLAVAVRLRAACARVGATLIINDRVDVARRAAADGVHLGRGDVPAAEARAALGPDVIVGATAGTIEEALAAERAGASYIGFGHIFPTTSKHKPGPPVGLEGLAAVCARVHVPVLAIGGITEDNAAACIEAGAHGIAVIAAVCAAPDPRTAARRLRSALPD
jgi:thiamine-phosphate pyrophosphorylase